MDSIRQQSANGAAQLSQLAPKRSVRLLGDRLTRRMCDNILHCHNSVKFYAGNLKRFFSNSKDSNLTERVHHLPRRGPMSDAVLVERPH